MRFEELKAANARITFPGIWRHTRHYKWRGASVSEKSVAPPLAYKIRGRPRHTIEPRGVTRKEIWTGNETH
jgi:hypothetical protein